MLRSSRGGVALPDHVPKPHAIAVLLRRLLQPVAANSMPADSAMMPAREILIGIGRQLKNSGRPPPENGETVKQTSIYPAISNPCLFHP